MNDLNAHIPTIGEIQSHASAQRYALALSGLAAAQERITALEKALEDAEWLRLQAESLAMTVLPALLAERDALAAKVEAVRALHYAEQHPRGFAYCVACDGDEFVPWPCPTIRALDGGE